ncbi:trypsin-like peptidase domain-containing protein [Kribbella endophytica]
MSVDGGGVQRDRVVAVVARLRDGRQQVGSGYLIGPQTVVTARHCTRDKATNQHAVNLTVVSSNDGGSAGELTEVVEDPTLDVAVLRLRSQLHDRELRAPTYARVERGRAGMLLDCQAIGYPLFQWDPSTRVRGTSEVHGTIYQTDGVESGRLLLREPLIRSVEVGGVPGPTDAGSRSPWGGLSGAVVFHAGNALGIVVEHHPRQGDAALQILAFESIAKMATTNEDSRRVAEALGLPAADAFPAASTVPAEPLSDLVELITKSDLPTVAELNAYQLGTTPSNYGNQNSHDDIDPYVPRTHGAVDIRLRAALEPSRLVVVTGRSAAGKTRTAFEAVHSRWPTARLLAPNPLALSRLIAHPRIKFTSDPIVVWLDDLDRFLTTSDPLTPSNLILLTRRPGSTILVATLRQEARARLLDAPEPTSGPRQLLQAGAQINAARHLLRAAAQINLQSIRDNPIERAAARDAYPNEDLTDVGLAERLAGAPILLDRYHDAQHVDPLLHALLRVAIDWARVGLPGPIDEADLCTLALDALWHLRPDLDHTLSDALMAVRTARRPPEGAGQVAMLITHAGSDRTRGYRPFDYLVAADDGQDGARRLIPDSFWDAALRRCPADHASAIGYTAVQRKLIPHAITAYTQAAETGDTAAARSLGILLAKRLDPPDLAKASMWYHRAAKAGDHQAMNSLGNLLADLDPPDLTTARTWYEHAADAGLPEAMNNLGNLLAALEPPDLTTARTWYERAADIGPPEAMYNLGLLLTYRLDPPEPATARIWFERAANAGLPEAMNLLGEALAEEEPPDLATARTWFERAADAGYPTAMKNLGNVLVELHPPDVVMARIWYERAAETGDHSAMSALADLLDNRIDPPDPTAATSWRDRSIELYLASPEYRVLNDMVNAWAADSSDTTDLIAADSWYKQAARWIRRIWPRPPTGAS